MQSIKSSSSMFAKLQKKKAVHRRDIKTQCKGKINVSITTKPRYHQIRIAIKLEGKSEGYCQVTNFIAQ